MRLRAAIFDIYGTLLEISPVSQASTIEAAWQALHEDCWHTPASLPFTRFAAESQALIAREHAASRALGIGSPEVVWPEIVARVLPALARLPDGERNAFLLRLAGLPRSLRLADGAADVLRRLRGQDVLLGIASNAQAYTRAELSTALEPFGLPLSIFTANLSFWSFEHGFSKPDPHVFRILTARLQAGGIHPSEVLMVGDRLDNDMEPARAFGWRTWHLHPTGNGSWDRLASWLDQARRPMSP